MAPFRVSGFFPGTPVEGAGQGFGWWNFWVDQVVSNLFLEQTSPEVSEHSFTILFHASIRLPL